MEQRYFDRKSGQEKTEIVAGHRWIRWTYETRPGRRLLQLVMKKRFFSGLMGAYMESPWSRRRIASFIRLLQIDMTEAEQEDSGAYGSFNEFFIRRLKPVARPIDPDPRRLVSPADGKLLVYEGIDPEQVVQIKGMVYPLGELLGDPGLAAAYEGGTCLVVRLNPADYHRFHFPDGGTPGRTRLFPGSYFSVNPLALKAVARLYCQNKRTLTIFQSHHFGKILLLEVGATGVGSIVQTHIPHVPVDKGQEKGYFKFGGSTVVLFFEKNRLRMDRDLLDNTEKGMETQVSMGEAIGSAC